MKRDFKKTNLYEPYQDVQTLKTSLMTAWKDKDWTDRASTNGEMAKEVVVNISSQIRIL